MNNMIEIKQLSKSFHGETVLHNINLEVKAGEFLTILGPSGCGKTTLLRLISGFESADTGTLLIEGKDVKRQPPHKRHVNTVFQSYALFPHMTVADNVAFGLRCSKVSESEIKQRVIEALTSVKLAHLAERRPAQLSGGQQQRVAIARAVVNKPAVLLLDEPLSALDYSLRKSMQIELKRLQRQLNMTFILVTHDQEEALSMSDRVVVMDHGVIEQIGTPREVYEEPKTLTVAKFIGETNLFETEVIRANAEQVTVVIEGRTFLLENTANFSQGQQVTVLVRPEDLRSWDRTEIADKDLEQLIPAKVEEVIYKGSTVDLILRTHQGTRLSVTEFFDEDDENLDYNLGEAVWVEWMLGWEVILPHD